MGTRKKPPKRSRMMKRRVPYQVFVSHATTDKWIARMICEKIESAGATTFRDDRDIESGDDIPDEIRKQLIGSNELVILMTPESVRRAWVLLEAGAFWGRKKKARIVAVLCHVEIDTIPDMIKSKKAISINDFDDYLDDLRRRIRAGKR